MVPANSMFTTQDGRRRTSGVGFVRPVHRPEQQKRGGQARLDVRRRSRCSRGRCHSAATAAGKANAQRGRNRRSRRGSAAQLAGDPSQRPHAMNTTNVYGMMPVDNVARLVGFRCRHACRMPGRAVFQSSAATCSRQQKYAAREGRCRSVRRNRTDHHAHPTGAAMPAHAGASAEDENDFKHAGENSIITTESAFSFRE